MRNRNNSVALVFVLVLVLVVENAIVAAFGSSLIMSNIICVAAFVFFNMSLSPGTLLGFAVTARDWGDVFRREMQGRYDPDGPEFARAASRSLTILSTFVLFALCMEFVRRGEGLFTAAVSVLTGMEAGFVAGYIVATRNCYSVS